MTHYDAIIIGSGMTGGWAAKELTERGLRVLVLDRGRAHEHGVDYHGEHASNWNLTYGGLPDRALYTSDYSVQRTSYAFDETTRQHFINDRENPYINEGATPFDWIRGSTIGGRSLMWARQSYRWGPQEFEANAQDGHGTDWPIRYADIAPWYSYVEKFVGISGQKEGLASFPDGEFQKPMEMMAPEKMIKRRLAKYCPELTFTIGRTAVLTEDLGNRAACHYCGACPRGCSTGSYFSSLSATLPAAEKTGRMTLRPDSLVEKLSADPESGHIRTVHIIDTNTKQKHKFSADMVFMCASTIASAQILLNSRTAQFPTGLANSSGVVGRYLMDHTDGFAGTGVILEHLDRYFYGVRPNGTYIPRFRNLNGQDADADFIRGYGFQTNMIRLRWKEMMHQPGIGKAYKDMLRKPGPWILALAGFGECLPNADNRVTLDPQKTDHYGLPQVRIRFSWGENERRQRVDMQKQAKRILRAIGASFITTYDELPKTANAIHEMGTIRMGKDKRTAALNGWNQSYDHPNLFVTDGAAMASTGYINPSLTYMAFTARAANYAADLWHKNKL